MIDDQELAFRQTLAVGDFAIVNPYPCWCKDYTDPENPVYLWISRSYEDIYDVTRQQFEGHGDKELWPEDVAATFLKHDLEAIEKTMIHTREHAPSKQEGWSDIQVTKWCVQETHFGHTFTFVYGLAGKVNSE